MSQYIHFFTKLQLVSLLLQFLLAAENGLYANGYEVNLLPHYNQTEWVRAFSSNNIVVLDDASASAHFSGHRSKAVFQRIAYHTQQAVKVTEKIAHNTFLHLKATQQNRAFLTSTRPLKATPPPLSLV